jgi:hypothetical protein
MAVAALISCNNTENKTPSTNTTDTVITKTSGTDTVTPKGKVLENELKNFITTLTSKDPQKIKQLFTFPVSDSMLNIYLDGTGNLLGYDNKGLITEEMFLKDFDKIYKFWMMDKVGEFTTLLKNIQLDPLNENKEINYDGPSDKTKPCRKHFSLQINNDIILFSYGYNSNPNFNKRNREEVICEADIIWEFKFDGKKLILIRQVAVG